MLRSLGSALSTRLQRWIPEPFVFVFTSSALLVTLVPL
jgi:short subunit fatty acids transporter